MSDVTSETPILDLLQPLPSHKELQGLVWWRSLLIAGAILIIPIIIAAIAVTNLNQPALMFLVKVYQTMRRTILDPISAYGAPFILVSLILIEILIIALHELGHIAVGKLVGFHIQSLCIGPLLIKVVRGKVTFQFAREEIGGGYAGMNIKNVRRLRMKLLAFILGGPLTHVASIPIAVGAANGCEILGFPAWLKAEFLLFGLISGIYLIVGLCPFKTRYGRFTDGALLIMLLTNRLKARRLLALYALAMQRELGTRSRLQKSTWIRAATFANDRSNAALAGFWHAYFWANDREDGERAAFFLENLLQMAGNIPPMYQEILIAEAANFQAWFRRNPERAQSWFERIPVKSKLPPMVRIRASISLHWVHNRQAEAIAAWNEGMKIIDELPEPTRERAMDSWNEWKDQLETRRSPSEEIPALQTPNHDLA